MLRNWDEIKQGEEGREQGVFGEVPENLPALLHARKVQRRAASSGFDFPASTGRCVACATSWTSWRPRRATATTRFHELGDVLFAAVNVARKLKVDPELALRAASERFRGRVEPASTLRRATGAPGTISRLTSS